MKKISVLVPCCNVEKYVKECLDSIKAQTYTNIEVICIDDGSTDSTGAIIDEYVAADPRFQVIHKPNTGYGDSMNVGLERCTGDYVGIVESDDWIEPNMYEVLLKTCESKDLDLIHCLWQSGPTGTENVDEMRWLKKDSLCCPLDRIKVFNMQPSIWAALYRRDLLEEGRKVRFLPTPGASFQDTSFAFKCYTKSRRFMFLSKALHHYRMNPGSSVSSTGKIYCLLDEWKEIYRWICEDSGLKRRIAEAQLLVSLFYGGFKWNYERLATVPRLKFLRAASHFFRQVAKDGLLNVKGYRTSRESRRTIKFVIDNPLEYYRTRANKTVDDLFARHSQGKEETDGPLISVIVVTYNTAKYIQSSLESICRQNYRNIEIICVDDCSTDESPMLVRHAMRKDNRITLVSTGKNGGPSIARNIGLGKAHGMYVVFVDGDDCLFPCAISKMYSRMSDDVDVVVGSAVVDYEGGKEAYGQLPKTDARYYTIKHKRVVDIRKEPKYLLKTNVCVWGKLWRRNIIEEHNVRFPKGMLYEDANFFFKYMSVGPKMLLLNEPVYRYLRHPNSIMSDTVNKKSVQAIHHLYILDDFYDYICRHSLEEIGRIVLNEIYGRYFELAYKWSPESDHDEVCSTMCRILKEQSADIGNNSLLKLLSTYDEVSKATLFFDTYKRRKKWGFLEKILGYIRMSPN